MREGLRALRAAGDTTTFEGMDPDGAAAAVHGRRTTCSRRSSTADDFADAKIRAMKAHATQIAVDGPFFALSNNIGNQVWGTEFYRLAKGVAGPDQRGRPRDRPVRRARVSPLECGGAALRPRRRAAGRGRRRAGVGRGAPRPVRLVAGCCAAATTYAVPWWLLRSRGSPAPPRRTSPGLAAVLAVVVAGRPEGDFVLASDLDGYALLGWAWFSSSCCCSPPRRPGLRQGAAHRWRDRSSGRCFG